MESTAEIKRPALAPKAVPWYRSARSRKIMHYTWVYLVIIPGAMVLIIPFLWMVSTALKLPRQIFIMPPQLIPDPVMWSNFVEGWTRYADFNLYLRNTLVIVTNNIIGNLVSCTLAAYGFARLKARGKNILFVMVLGTMMVPMWVTIIPQYVLFSSLHWTNSFLPLTVPAWFGWPFFIFLLRQFFMTIPEDLDDAARIDGASTWGVLWHILLPLCGPALATVAVFAFIGNWNNFLSPLIYLRDTNLYTLAIGLQRFQGTHGNVQYHYMMAVSTLIVLPIIVVFFLAQRLFVRGIVMTGLKG